MILAAQVWVAQIKDEYWQPFYTALVVIFFCAMPVCKFFGAMRLPPYDGEKLAKGLVAAVCSAVCFAVGLDDAVDPFRLVHGLSQALVGVALYYLWQLVPLVDPGDPRKARRSDAELQKNGMPPRVMSGPHLPISRLEYY